MLTSIWTTFAIRSLVVYSASHSLYRPTHSKILRIIINAWTCLIKTVNSMETISEAAGDDSSLILPNEEQTFLYASSVINIDN